MPRSGCAVIDPRDTQPSARDDLTNERDVHRHSAYGLADRRLNGNRALAVGERDLPGPKLPRIEQDQGSGKWELSQLNAMP